MSVSELNHLMTYVIEGWMLFSAGFTSIAFVSFVARRAQEDIEAAELAQIDVQVDTQTESLSASEEVTVAVTENADESLGEEAAVDKDREKARLEEVAAVSEKLAKAKEKQSSAPSVSVSTRPQ